MLPPSGFSARGDAILLTAALLDMSLFGLVCQQFYSYWTSGFKDSIHLKLFVNVQFVLVALQSSFIWHLVFKFFVNFHGDPPQNASSLWTGPANSLCQLVIILSANLFLANRIHGLTKSLIQSLLPVGFSIIALVFGLVTIVGTTWTHRSETVRYATSVIWYASQATAECLITFFLARALLKSRSGSRKSGLVVKFLVRNVIQTGVLATIWAIAALVSWFWLNRILIYRVFDITSGTVYMHAIFDTLISRTQLRDRMITSTFFDLGYPSQTQFSERFPGAVIVPDFAPGPSDSELGITNTNDAFEMGRLPPEKMMNVRYAF